MTTIQDYFRAVLRGARRGVERQHLFEEGRACLTEACNSQHTYTDGCLLKPSNVFRIDTGVSSRLEAETRLLESHVKITTEDASMYYDARARAAAAMASGDNEALNAAAADMADVESRIEIIPGAWRESPAYPIKQTPGDVLTLRDLKAFIDDLSEDDLDDVVALVRRCDNHPDFFHDHVVLQDAAYDVGNGMLLLSEIGCGEDDDHPTGYEG